MKKNLFVSLVLIFCFQFSYSQFKNPSKEKSKEFIKRKKLYVEDFCDNDKQREWFKKYWKFDHEIEFVSSEDLERIVKDKKDNAAILSAGRKNEAFFSSKHEVFYEVYMLALYLSEDAKSWNKLNINTRMKNELFKLSITHKPITEQCFKYIGQHFYNYLIDANGANAKWGSDKIKLSAERIASLKDKTLLIPKEICELNESEVSEVYQYPCKLADIEYIKSSISEESENAAYFNILFSDKDFCWCYFITDTKNGKILNRVGVGGVSFGIGIFNLYYTKAKPNNIKEKHLKYLNKMIVKSLK